MEIRYIGSLLRIVSVFVLAYSHGLYYSQFITYYQNHTLEFIVFRSSVLGAVDWELGNSAINMPDILHI